MRYLAWDVLLFPENSRVPIQEFKTSCHVIQDQEYFSTHNGMLLVPTVTSFVPALHPAAPFRVSIHSWETPQPSRYIRDYSQHPEQVIFEARVFIDGRLARTQLFNREGPWPCIIETRLELNKEGEEEKLIFPEFHPELLTQSYWNAGDDLGRIKVVISEGFRRSSETTRFERIKTIVAFSFQHAPLDILEASSIAWPSVNMWRQIPALSSYVVQSPTRRQAEPLDLHSHSPRRKTNATVPPMPASMSNHLAPLIGGKGKFQDPFIDQEGQSSRARRASMTDTSMPDYSSYCVSNSTDSRKVTDPSAAPHDKDGLDMQSAGAYEYVSAALLPAAPANTPQTGIVDDKSSISTNLTFENNPGSSRNRWYTYTPDVQYPPTDPTKLEPSNPTNGENSGIKSRKENLQHESPTPPSREDNLLPHDSHRRAGQAMTSNSPKRQRIITPASFRVIDEEDEPRSSPTARKSSHLVAGGHADERRALSGIDHNIV